jgi:hypothetical protein
MNHGGMRDWLFVRRLAIRFAAVQEYTIHNRDPATSTDLKMTNILFGLGLIAVIGLLM